MSRNAKPVVSLRKPPSADTVDAFVRGASAPALDHHAQPNITALPVAPSQPVTAPEADQPGIVARQDGRTRRRMTVYLPPELAQALKVQSAVRGEEMSDLIADALRVHLKL